MDYEKEYKEMVQRARELHESGNALTRKQMEIVCPELKESEDERIRKMLIEQMERWKKCAEDNNVEQDVKDASDAIAYLEKQKEQKPDNDRYMEGYMRGIGEQKPAEWSEEDEKMLCNVYESLYAYQCDIRAGRMDKNARELLDDVDAEKAWLKSLPARFHFAHWKPSEEQMEALRIAYEIGTANESWAMSVLKSLYEQLKSL